MQWSSLIFFSCSSSWLPPARQKRMEGTSTHKEMSWLATISVGSERGSLFLTSCSYSDMLSQFHTPFTCLLYLSLAVTSLRSFWTQCVCAKPLINDTLNRTNAVAHVNTWQGWGELRIQFFLSHRYPVWLSPVSDSSAKWHKNPCLAAEGMQTFST